MRLAKKIRRAILSVFMVGILVSLTGCGNQDTEVVTDTITEFIKACGNGEYGLAVGYLDSETLAKLDSANASKDESGLLWAKVSDQISIKMQDNSSAELESRKYVGHGIKLMLGNAKVEDIEIEGDEAKILLKGKGTLIHWTSSENIYEKISTATEAEFISDYNWYKDKIHDKGQKVVFSDIRNKVTPSVFEELTKELDKQEKIDYIKQVTMKRNSEGEWKITKIVTGADDGTKKNWFGDDNG